MKDIREFEGRKREHLRHALNSDHQATGLAGLEQVRLHHEALPELDLDEVSIANDPGWLGASSPFYVCGMTAGHARAPELNRVLARACAQMGWALGVGSQRRELEGGAEIDAWQALRAEAPGVALLANIGLTQAITAPVARLRELIERLGARALAVHANALQEAIQPEGTPRFRGGFAALRKLRRELGCPIVLKETGCGFSRATLERLRELDLAAIDVSGLGGTHWGRIEGARAEPGSPAAEAAATFADWGVPTVESTVHAARAFEGRPTEIWASGGVRTGLDAAKLIALGADRVGFAKPALEAALAGLNAQDGAESAAPEAGLSAAPEAPLVRWMRAREHELKIALFCTGSRSPRELLGKASL